MNNPTPKKHRPSFQLRRKEARAGQRDPYYNPERDLAHIGPFIVKGAMQAMETEQWEPWLAQFCEEQGITYDSIIESDAPLMLAKALNLIIGSDHPPAAMKEVGFDQLPGAMQLLFYGRLGQVLLAATWSAVKDVSRPDSDPPAAITELLDDMQTILEEFSAEQPHGDKPHDHPLGDGTACEEPGPV